MNSDPENLLLVDVSNILYRAAAVNSNLSHRGIYTGAFYGLLTQMASTIVAQDVFDVLLCWDTKPYYRSELLAVYKGDRESDNPMAKHLRTVVETGKELLQDFVEETRMPSFAVDGFEADDLIAYVAQHRKCSHYNNIFVLARDSDLYQILGDARVHIMTKEGTYSLTDFVEEFSIQPDKWTQVLAMTGTHNNVPGIKQVGIKTALKILKSPRKMQSTRLKHGELLDRNQEIITLPHPYLLEDLPTIPEATGIEYNAKKMTDFLRGQGISLTAQMDRAFDKVANV